MFSSLRNKAWAATLAVGGLLLIGTAAHGPMMPRVRVGIIVERPKAAARQHDRTTAAARIRPPARANPGTVGRTQPAASTGQERERSHDTSHESSRGHWGGGHWAHSRGHSGRASAHDGSKEGKFAHTSHESSRGHWGGGHWAHGRGHGGRASTQWVKRG